MANVKLSVYLGWFSPHYCRFFSLHNFKVLFQHETPSRPHTTAMFCPTLFVAPGQKGEKDAVRGETEINVWGCGRKCQIV